MWLFLSGDADFFDDPNDLSDLQDSARMLLKENGSVVSLPDKSFVFFMHQGYQFGYFIVEEENPNPEVFHYIEGKSDVTSLSPHLSAYFLAAIDAECELLGQNRLIRRIKNWFNTLYS